MFDGIILLAVHGLKVAIFALVGLASYVADLGCTAVQCDLSEDRAPIPVIVSTNGQGLVGADGAVVPTQAVSAVISVADPAERIRELVPPVRVEIVFPPDVLHPPQKL